MEARMCWEFYHGLAILVFYPEPEARDKVY
jgi:hypothetical protein